MLSVKKIVIIGPESTGKSTLCEQLAAHYRTTWVPEFARTYLLEHGMLYSYEDLLAIAKGQIRWEDEASKSLLRRAGNSETTPLFIDTDLHVMKVWCEFVFGNCHSWILDQIAVRNYDLYLLCNTDLPWVPDELREYPDLATRELLFHTYRDIMVNQQTDWAEICGSKSSRLACAIEAVDKNLQKDLL